MYGKIFESAFAGTLYGSGPVVFAVWSFVIANTKPPGMVELNPPLIARAIGTSLPNIRKAIEFLCKPDPNSRNPEEEGRRLIHLGGLQYQVVSFDKYRVMRSDEDRRDYMRDYMRDYRKNKHPGKQSGLNKVNESLCLTKLAEAEAEAEAEKRKSMAVNGRSPAKSASGFEQFWAAYPRKEKKPTALKAFTAINPDEALLLQMLDTIAKAKMAPQWQEDGGKYIPHPATWLNNRRWEDELALVPEAGHRNAVAGTRFVA